MIDVPNPSALQASPNLPKELSEYLEVAAFAHVDVRDICLIPGLTGW